MQKGDYCDMKRFFSIITDGESIEGLKFETGDKFNGEIINDTNNTISLQMYWLSIACLLFL